MAHALINAVAVLIIACPCALGLADADVDHGGLRARGATAGLLFKNAEAIEMPPQGRYPGRRQDRERSQSANRSWSRSDLSGHGTNPRYCARQPRSSAEANIRWRLRSSRERSNADWPLRAADAFESVTARSARTRGWPGCRARQLPLLDDLASPRSHGSRCG
jgi:hypothetical protein